MNFSRRELLKKSSMMLAGSYLLNPWMQAFAGPAANLQGGADQFLVFMSIAGGLDVTLGLDPQFFRKGVDESDLFLEYRQDEIKTAGNFRLGPAAFSLVPHFQDLAIINGVSVIRDAGHESNRRYMGTGNGSGTLANYSVQFAQQHTSPFGTVTNKSVDMGSISSPVAGIAELQTKLAAGSLSTPGLVEIVSEDLQSDVALVDSKNSETLAAYAKLVAMNPSWRPEFCALASSFLTGLSSSASLELDSYVSNNQFDSHSNHPVRHLASQKQAWEIVSDIFSIFKAVQVGTGTLFDKTTFVVVSEFSRTPYLNASQGKDHNPYANSVLLAGKGIKGNTKIGESYVWSRKETPEGISLHTGLPIDYQTGLTVRQADKNVDLIIPENIARTVLAASGIKKIPPSLEKFAALKSVLR